MTEVDAHKVIKDKNNRKKKKLHTVWLVFKLGIKLSILGFFFSILALAVISYNYYQDIRAEFVSVEPKNNVTQSVFYDKNGDIIYESFGTREPEEILLEEMPDNLVKATLAAEDLNFYDHEAYDLKSILRAVYKNYKSTKGGIVDKVKVLFDEGSYTEGGSTITQQLVKNIYLTNERSFDRKAKEIIYAMELEKKYTKDEILELYLTSIYYGEQALGIKNAADIYFDKEVADLSLAEITMLTGLPAAPTNYSPVSGDFIESKKRQEYVLQRMYLAGYINLKVATATANTELTFAEGEQFVSRYPFFVDWLKKELYLEYGEQKVESGGLKVYTTLDPRVQEMIKDKASEHVEKLKRKDVSNAAVVVINPATNEVIAMVGGLDYEKSKVNVATSKRQPGSSFKPIVYFTGLEEGYTASSKLLDKSVNFGGNPPYRPKNYDGWYRGYVTIRDSLAGSLNIPAVEMLSLVGMDKAIETADALGLSLGEEAKKCGLALALGCKEVRLLDMTNAYATFAANGVAAKISGVSKIKDSKNNDIYTSETREDVLDPDNSYIISHILSDEKARRKVFGYKNKLEIGRPAAAKTGTTDNYTDAWTIGYTPNYTVGVWVGNNDRSPMKKIGGIDGAAPIWNSVMIELHKDLSPVGFERPDGIEEAKISPSSGGVVRAGRWGILEVFKKGTVPTGKLDLSYLNIFR